MSPKREDKVNIFGESDESMKSLEVSEEKYAT